MSDRRSEFEEKLGRLRRLIAEKNWAWVALSRLDSLAWVTSGAKCFVDLSAETGVATILVSPDRVILATNRIEIDRLLDVELQDFPLETAVCEWPRWIQDQAEFIREITGGSPVASDTPLAGFQVEAADLQALRFTLTSEEQRRYRALGKDAAAALVAAARLVQRGDTETTIAARINAEVAARGMHAPVVLVASDDRVFKYRHPLPTSKTVDRYAMLVTSATRHGLYASVTRLVHFGEITKELRSKSRACAEIDAVMISATTTGTPVRQVFAIALEAYASHGYAEEWKLLHQGGAAGYRSREYFAHAGCRHVVQDGQAFAWNPSITGVKSEDTILVAESGPAVITATGDWPQISTESGLERPAILEL